jgi:flagellar biogenesis protein FliO
MFLGLAWLYRKSQPQGTAKLPLELVQVLGRTNIAPRQSMMVVRFGSKLLLVSQQPGQTETLAEISDPEEVDRLAGICESKTARSASQSFSNVLLQVAGANK